MIHQWMEWDIQLEFESWVSIGSSMEWGKLIMMIWLVVPIGGFGVYLG